MYIRSVTNWEALLTQQFYRITSQLLDEVGLGLHQLLQLLDLGPVRFHLQSLHIWKSHGRLRKRCGMQFLSNSLSYLFFHYLLRVGLGLPTLAAADGSRVGFHVAAQQQQHRRRRGQHPLHFFPPSRSLVTVQLFENSQHKSSFCLLPPRRQKDSTQPRGLASECTLLQKQKEVRFEFPVTIPVPYEPPGSGLSENIKIKKIYREVLSRKISKTTFFQIFS